MRTDDRRLIENYLPIQAIHRENTTASATLDARDVPSYVVDFVVYHELLHKKHGAKWQNGRQAVHTSSFRGMSAASLNTRLRKKRSSNSPSGWRLDPVRRVKLRIQPTHVDRLRGGQEILGRTMVPVTSSWFPSAQSGEKAQR